MKRSFRLCRPLFAALMTLAVFLVWAPAGSQAASLMLHAAAGASHVHHVQGEAGIPQPELHGALSEDCQASANRCCRMAHCHPALSVHALEMIRVATRGETAVAVPGPGAGSEPEVILPPPRRP
jgi:hypothetical protein